jgi:hypothetical protein
MPSTAMLVNNANHSVIKLPINESFVIKNVATKTNNPILENSQKPNLYLSSLVIITPY